MGCLFRLGCLVLLIIGGIIAWLTRDRWMDRMPWHDPPAVEQRTTSAEPDWMPLSQAAANRTRDSLQKLSGPKGPVFVTLSGADAASFIFLQLVKQLPASSDSFAARVDDDQVRLRANMETRELGSSVLATLGSLISDRERVEMSGRLNVIGKGMAEFQVTDVKIRNVSLPDAVIPRLVKPLVRGTRPAGLSETGLPIAIPSYIGDVRVARGKITLYKNVP